MLLSRAYILRLAAISANHSGKKRAISYRFSKGPIS